MRDHADAAGVGWWWGNVKERGDNGLRNVQREVDVVAVDHEGGVLALGSCKWTAGPMPSSEKTKLQRMAKTIASDTPDPDLYLFSRAGFDPKLVAETQDDAKCHLIAPEDLF